MPSTLLTAIVEYSSLDDALHDKIVHSLENNMLDTTPLGGISQEYYEYST